tara:strand:- start:1008 stop:1808 length:801 start_codon:yes stop_codon:yes gene_type:complete
MKIDFFKYEGTGNDFVIIDNRGLTFQKKDKTLIQNICDRKKGVGSDGLILLENHDKLDFSMIYFNADGSESGFCGNGSRCITHLANNLNIINDNAKFNAIDGIHESKIANGRISVKMNDVLKSEIFKYNDKYNTTFIDTGSPHLIRIYENIDSIDIVKEARELKLKYSEYTDGLNINFCEISDSKIKLRTYERGVEDETLSCGTGAVASTIFLKDSGLVRHGKLEILMKGGLLCVELNNEKNLFSDIWLSGEVNMVFKGGYNKLKS